MCVFLLLNLLDVVNHVEDKKKFHNENIGMFLDFDSEIHYYLMGVYIDKYIFL